jgi:hypothetical protein
MYIISKEKRKKKKEKRKKKKEKRKKKKEKRKKKKEKRKTTYLGPNDATRRLGPISTCRWPCVGPRWLLLAVSTAVGPHWPALAVVGGSWPALSVDSGKYESM